MYFSPYSFRTSSCILEEGWDSYGCVSLIFCGIETLFTFRSNFQEKDLYFESLTRISCRVSSVCKLDPIGLEPLFVKVSFRRCHCAPSMFKGPDGS